VSYAYSNSRKVSEAQRARIYAVAESMGYAGPSVVGSGLRSGRVGAVGVVVADSLVHALDDPSTTLLMKGIVEVSSMTDVAITLLSAATPGKGPRSQALRGLVDGVVLHNMPSGHPLIQALVTQGIPTVVVDSPREHGLPYVGIDDRNGALMQMRHLLELGHRRIGVVVDRLHQNSERSLVSVSSARAATERNAHERFAGYVQACREAGLPLSSLSVVDAAGIDDAAGAWATQRLMDADPSLTAIVAMSDVHAAAAYRVLRERGYDVPGDISVIGFDDAPVAQLLGLSTIHQPITEKGRAAASILLDRIAGGTRKRSLLKTRLIQRDSTGAPRP
jgi:DNA-binding LacI/PurR family transcriptional regulator